MTEKLTQKDYELINSYLDQELDRKAVIRFAERMAEDQQISSEVADLMKVKAMVRELPTVTPPRNYILTRAMAEEARPKVPLPARTWQAKPSLPAVHKADFLRDLPQLR